jgi:phosphoglycolate phosphatase
MIKAVLFDFDDTLVTTFETKSRAVQDFGKKYYNKDVSLEVIRESWKIPFPQTLEYLFGDVDNYDSIVEKYMPFRNNYPAKAYPDAVEVINALSQKYKVGVVSSSNKTALYNDLGLIGLSIDGFYYIQTSEDTSVHKPDPRVFMPIRNKLQEIQIHSGNIVYVGDGLMDYFAARDAGFSFYGICDRTTSKEKFTKEGAQTITALSDLLRLL